MNENTAKRQLTLQIAEDLVKLDKLLQMAKAKGDKNYLRKEYEELEGAIEVKQAIARGLTKKK